MFQMRLGFFAFAVAGCALICWAILYYQANIDISHSMINQRISDLSSTDVATRKNAANALDGIPAAQLHDGATALAIAMRDPDASVRSAACGSLATSLAHYFHATNGEIPVERNGASLLLIEALRDPDATVRASAAQGMTVLLQRVLLKSGNFGSLGVDPKIAIPPLVRVLDDPDPITALRAYRALMKIAESQSPAASSNPVLTSLGIDPVTINRTLRREIQGANRVVRAEAVTALAYELRDQAAPPDEILAFLSDDQPAKVRMAAENAFADVGGQRKPWSHPDDIARALARRLAMSKPIECWTIIYVLSTFKTIPDDLVPPLITALEAANSNVDDSFESSIVDLVPLVIVKASPKAALAAIPALSRAAWKHAGWSTSAASAIAQIAPDSPEGKALIPILAAQLKNPASEAVISAAQSLAMLGPRAIEAAPALLEVAGQRDLAVRKAAVLALGSIGPEAKFVVPTLANLAEKEIKHLSLPTHILDAIVLIDPNSPEAAELLMSVVPLSDEEYRGQHKETNAFLARLPKLLANNPTLLEATKSPDHDRKLRAKTILDLLKTP